MSHLFKRTRYRGHQLHKHKGAESSYKKRGKIVKRNFKMSNSNALLRRIKIVFLDIIYNSNKKLKKLNICSNLIIQNRLVHEEIEDLSSKLLELGI